MNNSSGDLGLDIDGVITAFPDHFASLSTQWRNGGGHVHIVSSRSNRADVLATTKAELDSYGIAYDSLYLLPSIETAQVNCQEKDLDWYQKYICQKVNYCIENQVGTFYDDDLKVVELFRKLCPHIKIFHVIEGGVVMHPEKESK